MEKRITKELIDWLLDEKQYGIKAGIYNFLQVDTAYHSNHIEGSKFSHDQTSYIYETHSFSGEHIRIDDVIETINHFRCFASILDTMGKPLTEEYIKELYKILKTGTFSSCSKEAVVGDYQKYPNMVRDIETADPAEVSRKMIELIRRENSDIPHCFDDLLAFHASFEKIHPFYDGNGSTDVRKDTCVIHVCTCRIA